MTTLADMQEEASIARKWATERLDWISNPNTQKRYASDPHALQRKAGEADVMLRLADRMDRYSETLKQREAAI